MKCISENEDSAFESIGLTLIKFAWLQSIGPFSSITIKYNLQLDWMKVRTPAKESSCHCKMRHHRIKIKILGLELKLGRWRKEEKSTSQKHPKTNKIVNLVRKVFFIICVMSVNLKTESEMAEFEYEY